MKIGRSGRHWVAVAIVLASGVALGGCREEEQDRILLFEQGEYLGQPDETLDESQVEELRSRATRQQY